MDINTIKQAADALNNVVNNNGSSSEAEKLAMEEYNKRKEEQNRPAGQRISNELKKKRDNFLVWLCTTFTGWCIIISIIGFVVLLATASLGWAIGGVVALWALYGIGYYLKETIF